MKRSLSCLAAPLILAQVAVAQTPPSPPEPAAPPRAEQVEAEQVRAAAIHEAEVARSEAAVASMVRREEARARAESARVEAFAEALESAEEEQRAALEAVAEAREQLARQAAAQREAEQASNEDLKVIEERERERAEELRVIQGELARAHASLRSASREVAHVHRDLHRTDARRAPRVVAGGQRAVIGVILGDDTGTGVKVLGVSPDGPAERAGLQQGDVIVSLMGEPLTEGRASGRVVLGDAMREVEVGDELIVVVDRDGETITATVTAEERTPFTWQSVTRLSTVPSSPSPPSAPGAPSAPVIVQSFEIPDVDMEALEESLESVRREFEERRIVIDRIHESGDENEFYFEIDQLSEMGDSALAGTNIWFGMPLTRGLQFAELNEDLGAYFQADQGVLVLSAKDDNALQLLAGDVVLNVDGTDVTSPADIMRALRRADAGEIISLDVIRQGGPTTIEVEVPDNLLGFLGNRSLEFPEISGGLFYHQVPGADQD